MNQISVALPADDSSLEASFERMARRAPTGTGTATAMGEASVETWTTSAKTPILPRKTARTGKGTGPARVLGPGPPRARPRRLPWAVAGSRGRPWRKARPTRLSAAATSAVRRVRLGLGQERQPERRITALAPLSTLLVPSTRYSRTRLHETARPPLRPTATADPALGAGAGVEVAAAACA